MTNYIEKNTEKATAWDGGPEDSRNLQKRQGKLLNCRTHLTASWCCLLD